MICVCIQHLISTLHHQAQKKGLVNNLKDTVNGIASYLPSFLGKKKEAAPEKITYRIELKKYNDSNVLIYCRNKEALEGIRNNLSMIYSRLLSSGKDEYALELTLSGINVLCNLWNTPYNYDDILKELKLNPKGVKIDPEETVKEFELFKIAFYKEDRMPFFSYFFSEARRRMEKRHGCLGSNLIPFHDMDDVLHYANTHPGSDASKVVDKYFSHLKPRTINLGIGAKLVLN